MKLKDILNQESVKNADMVAVETPQSGSREWFETRKDMETHDNKVIIGYFDFDLEAECQVVEGEVHFNHLDEVNDTILAFFSLNHQIIYS